MLLKRIEKCDGQALVKRGITVGFEDSMPSRGTQVAVVPV